MSGRLGNQMFRYAVAKCLQNKYYPNDKIVLNYTKVDNANKIDKSYYRSLLEYNARENFDICEEPCLVLKKYSNLFQKILTFPYYFKLKKLNIKDVNGSTKLEKKYSKKLMKNGIYWFRYGEFELAPSKQKNKIISGNFESPKYFNDVREELLKDFTPIIGPSSKNKKLYDIITSKNSICVSIRRGDFLDEENAIHNVCTSKYYYNAIEYMKKVVKNPVFIFFSDDIEWVKNNIKIDCESYYEDGDDPVYEKLRMMYSCKHYIISNSTFSWWSQFLSRNKDRIVVSPTRWFNGVDYYPLLEDWFVKIEG